MLKEGEIRIPSGCAISGIFAKDGSKINGSRIIKSMVPMHDRSNGLGGGFAGYGIYPQYADYYALHIFYDNKKAKIECEEFLDRHFEIASPSELPTRKTHDILNEPIIWRYFVKPNFTRLVSSHLDEKEYVARCVIKINTVINGAYVF